MAAASVSASAAMAGSRRAAGGCSSCRATVAAPHRHQSDCWGAAKVPARRKAAAATAAAAAASSATERLAADEGTVPTRRLSSQEVGARPVLIACFAGFGLPLSPPSPVPAIRLTCATTQHLNPRPPATPPCPAPPPGHRGAVREPARAAAHRVLRRVLQQRPGGHRHRPRALCRAGGCGGVGGAACCCCCWWGGGWLGGWGGGQGVGPGGAWGGWRLYVLEQQAAPPGAAVVNCMMGEPHPPTLPPSHQPCVRASCLLASCRHRHRHRRPPPPTAGGRPRGAPGARRCAAAAVAVAVVVVQPLRVVLCSHSPLHTPPGHTSAIRSAHTPPCRRCCAAVFDTTLLVEGCLYQLDAHLQRFLESAAKAAIPLPRGMTPQQLRRTILETAAAGRRMNGARATCCL